MRKSKTSVLKGMPTIIPIEKSDAFIYFVYVKISNHHMLFQRPLSKSEFVENCYASTYKQSYSSNLAMVENPARYIPPQVNPNPTYQGHLRIYNDKTRYVDW